MTKVIVIGAGIVGLATAAELARNGEEVVVLDKEPDVARHQTGRNSGVIHSGLYYAPGSLKAQMSVAGAASMAAYAREHGVAVDICGKLVVATAEEQLPQLRVLAERAAANGVPARMVSVEEAREYEPNVRCVAALRVESTGIVDYTGVSRALAQEVRDAGGEIRFDAAVRGGATENGGVSVRTDSGDVRGDVVVNCAGLHSDRIALAFGLVPEARIVPFRGEYFELTPERASLVKGLIYPVPDPRFPFLGVHLTRMIDGSIHAGPNAVLALAREGYGWSRISVPDILDFASWPGLWRMGVKNLGPAVGEVARSLSRRRFAASLAELVPAIAKDDLVPAKAGVRAQAIKRDGKMVDDFLIQRAPRQVHVLNAPSPAATASLEIAKHIARQVEQVAA